MTLVELLVAGAIVGSSCCASLQVFNQAAATSQLVRTRRQARELLSLHWIASRRWMMTAEAGCSSGAMALEQQITAEVPLDGSLQRRFHDDADSLGVWMEVHHPSTGLQRRQLFTGTGSGWCRDVETSVSDKPTEEEE